MDSCLIPGTSFRSAVISAMSESVRYSLESLAAESTAGAAKHTYLTENSQSKI